MTNLFNFYAPYSTEVEVSSMFQRLAWLIRMHFPRFALGIRNFAHLWFTHAVSEHPLFSQRVIQLSGSDDYLDHY